MTDSYRGITAFSLTWVQVSCKISKISALSFGSAFLRVGFMQRLHMVVLTMPGSIIQLAILGRKSLSNASTGSAELSLSD